MGSAPEDEEASAMAAAMGFSSFGAQDRPQKKRRYNAAADTVTCAVAGAAAAAAPPTTASNATPLGGGAAASTQTSSHDNSNSNSNTITSTSTSTSTTDKGVSALQSLPAHLVGLPARPAASGAELSSSSTQQQQQQQHSSWPQKKQHQRHQQQDHGPRKLWYEGYYDSLSNDNPWERLEKAMGLPSKGSWMVAGQARPQTQ